MASPSWGCSESWMYKPQQVLSSARQGVRAHGRHLSLYRAYRPRHPYLQARVLPHPQPSHPHVSQQHLAAGVGDEVPMFGCDSQFEAGRVAPVFQLVGQQFHGDLLVMLVGLVQELHSKLAKVSAETEMGAGWSHALHSRAVSAGMSWSHRTQSL